MPQPGSLMVVFRPGMYPAERHAIEDQVQAALGEWGVINGGGTAVDLSECDFTLDVVEVKVALRLLREVLQRLAVPPSTVILQFEPERIEHRVYP